MIPLFSTPISPQDAYKAREIIKLGLLSEGDVVKNFEAGLGKRFNLRYVFTTNSGTSALHLALILAGIKSGDEVILPAQTFVATGFAILYCGAKPVFADIDSTGNIDYTKISSKITEKTKAVIGVDWAGYPCDRPGLREVCRNNNLKLIIDAAHSLGAINYDKKYVGEDDADFVCFSFQAIKHLTTGDGGAVVCKNQEDYERGKRLRWFGIDRDDDLADETGERLYDLSEIGYKYHMNNVAAAIGINQLNTISNNLTRRREIATYYDMELGGASGISPLSALAYHGSYSSYWLYPCIVDNRNDFIDHLKRNDIQASVVHQGIDRNTIFGGLDESLVGQRLFDITQVNIPVHDLLQDKEIEWIVRTIYKGW